MKDMSTTENIEGTEKRERRGERLQGIPLERDRPCGRQKFRGSEILKEKVPMFGSFERKTSKVWKFWREKFQGLEILEEKVPRFGTLWLETSKPWNFQDRTAVRYAEPGASTPRT